MSERTFTPVSTLRGGFTPPADKSILHRGLLLAGMAGGASRIVAASSGADVHSTARCLRALGVSIERDGAEIRVAGHGWRIPDRADLTAGNSGTTMRLLAGAVAGRRGSYRLSGDESLSRRPMLRIAEPLRSMGATVELAPGDTPPVRIAGGDLRAIRYALPVASAQVKGCVLLAGLQAPGTTTVVEKAPTRDHTERLLEWLQCRVSRTAGEVSVTGGEQLFETPGFDLEVPGDLSSAAFLVVAACLVPGSRVRVEGVGLNPGRTGFLTVLEAMGAELTIEAVGEKPEPVGTVEVHGSPLRSTRVDEPLVPRCVDELPLLALAATQAEGETVIAGAGELRFKESNRIDDLAAGLTALGARVEAEPDGLRIVGPTPLTGGSVDAGGDHRLALVFAVAGLVGREPVEVRGWEATRISYPEFEGDLVALIG